eukprot:gene17019-20265_t
MKSIQSIECLDNNIATVPLNWGANFPESLEYLNAGIFGGTSFPSDIFSSQLLTFKLGLLSYSSAFTLPEVSSLNKRLTTLSVPFTSGTLPTSWSLLTKLSNLVLLTGTISSQTDFSIFKNPFTLSITGNVFTASQSIPVLDFKDSPYLSVLYFNDANNLLSSKFLVYPMIKMYPLNSVKASLTVNVSGNSLAGPVPPGLCQARRPSDDVKIDLSYNDPLTGTLPTCFSCSIDLWHPWFMGNNNLKNLDLSFQWKWEGCPTLAFDFAFGTEFRVPTSGGTITINGTDFGWDAVPVASTSPNVTIVVPNKMLVLDVPPGTGGPLPHVYKLLVGRMNHTFDIGYFQPNVTTVEVPMFGGQQLQLLGTDFGSDITKVSVFIDDVMAEVLEVSNTSINVTSLASKFTNITVVVDGQASSDQPVKKLVDVVIPPTITYYTPIYYGQMSNITINGTDLFTVVDVMIGNKTCILMSVSKSQIVCSFAADVPVVNGTALPITLTNSDSRFYSFHIFLYRQLLACPTSTKGVTCSNYGACNQDSGQCTCISGYGGSSCSFKVSDSRYKLIPTSFGSTVVSGDSGSFLVGIGYLREIDTNNKTIITRKLSEAYWSQIDNHEKNLTVFTGTYPNTSNLTITIDMKMYLDSTTLTFAQDIIEISSNSVKHHIVITNYPFQSTTNSLQVIYSVSKDTEPECSQVIANDKQNAVNYEISTPSSLLVSRYARTMVVDHGIIKSTAVILDDLQDELVKLQKSTVVLTMIQVPYFSDSVELDPNYNMLVKSTPDDDSKCSPGSATSWILPVATVVSFVITAIIITGVILFTKKLLMGRRLSDVLSRRFKPLLSCLKRSGKR